MLRDKKKYNNYVYFSPKLFLISNLIMPCRVGKGWKCVTKSTSNLFRGNKLAHHQVRIHLQSPNNGHRELYKMVAKIDQRADWKAKHFLCNPVINISFPVRRGLFSHYNDKTNEEKMKSSRKEHDCMSQYDKKTLNACVLMRWFHALYIIYLMIIIVKRKANT